MAARSIRTRPSCRSRPGRSRLPRGRGLSRLLLQRQSLLQRAAASIGASRTRPRWSCSRFPRGAANERQAVAISADFLERKPVYEFVHDTIRYVIVTSPEGANRVYDARRRGGTRFATRTRANVITDADRGRWTVTEAGLVREADGTALPRVLRPARLLVWLVRAVPRHPADQIGPSLTGFEAAGTLARIPMHLVMGIPAWLRRASARTLLLALAVSSLGPMLHEAHAADYETPFVCHDEREHRVEAPAVADNGRARRPLRRVSLRPLVSRGGGLGVVGSGRARPRHPARRRRWPPAGATLAGALSGPRTASRLITPLRGRSTGRLPPVSSDP